MSDFKWIGTSPSNAFLSADGSPDQNVHFQDIVKVTQGIIELQKTIENSPLTQLEIHDLKIHQVGQMNTKGFINCLKRF